MRNANLTRTLPCAPEALWLLRRRSIGQTPTLPVTEEAQSALRALRDEVVGEHYARLVEAEVGELFAHSEAKQS